VTGSRALSGIALVLALGAGLACRRPDPVRVAGGDPGAGRDAIAGYHCGACHVIPGVRGARGVVGPPLTGFAQRAYIGGQVPNTPENLVQWVMDPGAIEPGTAMPALGIPETQARDVAAYLYELR
jgi:cytochrome c2